MEDITRKIAELEERVAFLESTSAFCEKCGGPSMSYTGSFPTDYGSKPRWDCGKCEHTEYR